MEDLHVGAGFQRCFQQLSRLTQPEEGQPQFVQLKVEGFAFDLADLLHALEELALALLQRRHVAPRGRSDLHGDGLCAQFDPLGHFRGHLHALLDGAHAGLGVGQQLQADALRVLHGVFEVDEGVAAVIAEGALAADGLVAHVAEEPEHLGRMHVAVRERRAAKQRQGVAAHCGHAHRGFTPVAARHRQVLGEADDVVVFGEADALVGADAAVAQHLVAVAAAR